MPERHGPYVPELPEVKPDPDYPQCQRFDQCKRRDGHTGPCLPDSKVIASLKQKRLGVYRDKRGAEVHTTDAWDAPTEHDVTGRECDPDG